MIDTILGTHFIDKKLQPSTEYSYTVKQLTQLKCIERKYSAYSKTTVATLIQKHQHNQKGLHSMGTTASSVDLIWSPSDDNIV